MDTYKARVVMMSMGFFGLFMAFNAAQALATSLSGDLGNICLATLYVTFTFACVGAPPLVYRLGPRLSMIIGAVPYVLMILANLQPSYYLSVPVNFLVGLGAPLLWTGEGVYVGECALAYATSTHTSKAAATSEFNALFFSSFQANGVAGLVTSSLILVLVSGDSHTILFIVMGAIAIFGIVLLTFVRPVHDKTSGSVNDIAGAVVDSGSRQSLLEQPPQMVNFNQTLRLIVDDPRMRWSIPIIFYNGLSLGFMFGDYSADVATQALGVNFTGFVLASFYLSNSVATAVFGRLAGTRIGRRGLVWVATIVHILFYVWFLVWKVPKNYNESVVDNENQETKLDDPDAMTYGFAFAGAIWFAIGDSIWESQPPAVLQTYFDKQHSKNETDGEAAMANLKMWQSLGFAIQFGLGVALADYFWIRIVILLAMQVVGTLCLLYVDYKIPGGQLDN